MAYQDHAAGEDAFAQALIEHLPGIFLLLDAGGRITRWNRDTERFTGYAASDLAGCPHDAILQPEAEAAAGDRAPALLADVGSDDAAFITRDVLLRDAAGQHWPVAANIRRLAFAGEPVFVVIATDITLRKAQEARERRRNEILTSLARGVPLEEILDQIARAVEAERPGMLCSILLYDAGERRLYHGAAPNLPAAYIAATDGVTVGEGVGSCGTAAHRGERVIAADIATDPSWLPVREITLASGLRSSWSQPVFASTGELLGTFAIYHREPRHPDTTDIERIERATRLASLAIERSRLAAALEYAANHDSLTNLHSRRRTEELLSAEIHRADRYGSRFALIMLDVDGFKAINDVHGHRSGDRVLCRIGAVLNERHRKSDICGRWGGEEFLVILPETALDTAEGIAENLRATIAASDFPDIAVVTVSAGVCAYRRREGFDGILARVDRALYDAKAAGRNRIVAA